MAFYGNLSFPRHWIHLQITQATPLLAASNRIFELSEGAGYNNDGLDPTRVLMAITSSSAFVTLLLKSVTVHRRLSI